MKQCKHFWLTIAALLCSIVVKAHDFEVDGIYYNITSEEAKQAEVTYKGNSYDSYHDEYSGSVTLPATVTYNGVAYRVTSIGSYAFYNCSSLTAITIPEGVTSIGDWAFYGCSSLTAITIPEGVTSIGEGAFSGCSSLTTIVVAEGNPNSDSRDGCDAIIETNSNTLITGCSATIIPKSVTTIGDYAFYGCSSLTAITIPEGVTSIEFAAFKGCSSLTAINIPEGVTSIGDCAFINCSSLIDITIPKCVTNIGDYVFACCSSLTAIVVAEGNPKYDSRDGCDAIIETNSNTLITGCSATIIPEGVMTIGDNAFYGCFSLTTISIPKGVTSIGDYAFWDCYNLTAITIPESVTSIGYYAFAYCSSLTTITIPEGVTSIGPYAFSDCSSLTAITCEATTPPTISGSYTFDGVDKSIPVYVPAGSVEAYKAAEGWSEFANIRPITDEYVLKVSAVGYATLYLDYAAEIPDNVKAYIATSVEGDRLMMTQVTGVLPANTGVIVRAKEGAYTFVESDDTPANVDGNLLSGTATDTYITAESGYRYYVLAQKEGMVGMYRPKLTDGQFLNNANKAYLRLESDDLGIFDDETNTEDEGGQLSNRLRFDFGGTTDVEMTTGNGGQTTVIYDLQGRRVENPTKPGIYIVNGQKVVF